MKTKTQFDASMTNMKVKFEYDASMTLLNCLETLEKILPQFGVKLTMLDGGDGYEEIELTKIEG